MKIKYRLIEENSNVILPVKTDKKETAFSLFWNGDVDMEPGAAFSFAFGYSLDLPKGYVAKVHTPLPLVKHSSSYAVTESVFNSGEEITVSASNRSMHNRLMIKAGDRVAILTIEKVEQVQFEKAE